MYTPLWFITLYTGTFSMEISNRIWDLLVIDGLKIVYKVGIAFLKIYETKLLNFDFEETMQFF